MAISGSPPNTYQSQLLLHHFKLHSLLQGISWDSATFWIFLYLYRCCHQPSSFNPSFVWNLMKMSPSSSLRWPNLKNSRSKCQNLLRYKRELCTSLFVLNICHPLTITTYISCRICIHWPTTCLFGEKRSRSLKCWHSTSRGIDISEEVPHQRDQRAQDPDDNACRWAHPSSGPTRATEEIQYHNQGEIWSPSFWEERYYLQLILLLRQLSILQTSFSCTSFCFY